MSYLEDFENTLKDVVNAKRLSASKMTKLTDITLKSVEHDTKLVAILYRTHKSLSSTAKVSSLYAFDALARAARSYATKRGIIGDINSSTGNAATFLLKVEGVLDGLFQDMIALDNAEAKEKTKKVLDIWTKSNTFPSPVLARLREIMDSRKETVKNPMPPVTRVETQALPIITTPPSATPSQGPTPPLSESVQSTLLALVKSRFGALLNLSMQPNTTKHRDCSTPRWGSVVATVGFDGKHPKWWSSIAIYNPAPVAKCAAPICDTASSPVSSKQPTTTLFFLTVTRSA